jgi:serine/threonine protein phosphatase PrpC
MSGPDSAWTCPGCDARPLPADRYCEECGALLDEFEIDAGTAAVVSDRGRRRARNEDAAWLAVTEDAVLVVVADGVSQSASPALASRTAARVGGEVLAAAADPRAALVTAYRDAARAVAELAGEEEEAAVGAPATTLVAAVVSRAAGVAVVWAGDSRVYWVPETGPAQLLTADDCLAGELVAAGMDAELAYGRPDAQVLTDWLGAGGGQHPDRYHTVLPDRPGTLVLCTDGLWNYLPDPDAFAAAVRGVRAAGSALRQAHGLVDLACARGGHDNVTVAVVPFVPATGLEGAR